MSAHCLDASRWDQHWEGVGKAWLGLFGNGIFFVEPRGRLHFRVGIGNVSAVAEVRKVYCRCAFANVVPEEVKDEVLKGLCASGTSFDTVPDLCEMAARKDPRLQELAGAAGTRIAACYPRAVKWLLHSAGLSEEELSRIEVANMREDGAEEVLQAVLSESPIERKP